MRRIRQRLAEQAFSRSGIVQSAVRGVTPLHEQALARTPGDWSHPAQAAERGAIPPPQGIAAVGQQRGGHTDADTGQRQQNFMA